MKLQTRFTLYFAGVLATMGIALILTGYWIITQIIFQQYERQFARELENLTIEVEQSFATLEKAGILDLREYVLSAQENLIAKFQDYHFGETGYLYIIDQQSRVVYHPGSPTHKQNALGIEQQLLSGQDGRIEFDFEGSEHFGVFKRTGVWGWTIMLAIQQREMFIHRNTYSTLVGVIALLAFLLMLGVSRALAKLTTTRIEHTLTQLRKMETGDFGTRFIARGKDEINRIEQGINRLIEQIELEIDQRRQSESEMRQAKEAAEIANAAKSEFLSTMSHEVRTPMNGVIGMTHLLKETQLNDEQQQYLSVIEDSSEAMMHVLSDILDFSRLESGQIELEQIAFDLNEVIDGLVRLFVAEAAAKSIEIKVENLLPLAVHYVGDVGRIRQILINLLGNAVKFTEQGAVRIRIEAVPIEAGVSMHMVRFEIVDTGIGIPAEKISSLFDSFVQADASITRKYGGSGLGLAICKKLVALMGGAMDVESEPGRGSCFWFEIPMQSAHAGYEHTTADGDDTDGASSRSLRILVVEDIVPNQLVAKKLLEKLGHKVEIANNGLEAIAMLQDFTFDLILMDIRMPEMDGLTATREIRKSPRPLADIPIVALTANATQEDTDACISAGMNGFLPKPIELSKLKSVLQQYV